MHSPPRAVRVYRLAIVASLLSAVVPAVASAQRPVAAATIVRDWTTVGRHTTVVDSAGRQFVRFDDGPGIGLAWTHAIDFADGEIEFDVRGRDILQKSFVGIAFHIAADTAFDAVYLRPFNFAAADSARRAHAIQYVAYPGWPWERTRAEQPGTFEKPVLPEPDPNAWNHVRLAVHGTDVRVFVNGNAVPALHVQAPSGRTHGGVGLWVGDSSPGDFANLVVRRTGSRPAGT